MQNVNIFRRGPELAGFAWLFFYLLRVAGSVRVDAVVIALLWPLMHLLLHNSLALERVFSWGWLVFGLAILGQKRVQAI